jgi:hypothetical protein
MAITTLDGAIAGMQPTWPFSKAATPTLVAGKPQSLWYLAGVPGAGAAPAASLNGANLVSSGGLTSNIAGQLPWLDPGSGNSYLARLVADASIGGNLLLCDRLWHNGGYTITSTGAQSSTTSAWPARDINGSTNGVGVLFGLEVSAATGANAPTITVTYTNSGGTGSRTGAFIFPTAASASIGSFFPIGLQAGDVGVQSLQSIQFGGTAWASGTVNMVAYRVVASLEIPNVYVPNAIDLVTGGMSQFFNGSVPFLIFIPSSTTASLISGGYAVTQG